MSWTDVRPAMTACLLGAALAASACQREEVSAEAGRSLYRQNGCGSCHGASGRGDGPISQTLDPRPTDLTQPATFKRGNGEVAIADTLASGIPAPGSMPGIDDTIAHHHSQGMPPYPHLSMGERRSLARYINSLEHGSTR
ncbi:MAG: c-type cytochrome [Vicinamibacterales bacterium]